MVLPLDVTDVEVSRYSHRAGDHDGAHAHAQGHQRDPAGAHLCTRLAADMVNKG
jgi:hypothetical protein